MADIPEAELRELIALGGKATERPWGARGSIDNYTLWAPVHEGFVAVLGCHSQAGVDQQANADFVAASANLAVPLAEEVLRLWLENAELRAQVIECDGRLDTMDRVSQQKDAEIASLKARAEDLEMMLMAALRGRLHSMKHTEFEYEPGCPHFADGHGPLKDDGTGLPLLTAEAREALKGTR